MDGNVGGYSPLEDTMKREQALEIWIEMTAMYPQLMRGDKKEVEARQRVWGRLLSQANYEITRDLLEQHYLSNEFAPKPADVIRIKQRHDPTKTTVKQDMQAVHGDNWQEVYERERAEYKRLEEEGYERMRNALKGDADDK